MSDLLLSYLKDNSQIENFSQEQVKSLISELNSIYHNGESLISDKEFDSLLDFYHMNFGEKLKFIGAEITSNINVKKIPHAIVSLDKIKSQKEIERWKSSKTDDFFIQDKIDGATLLIGRTSQDKIVFFTRGGGRDGAVLELEQILNLPYSNIPKNFYIRGELVIHKNTFGKLENYNGIRNVVSGFLNSKVHDPELGSKFTFYAYKIYSTFDVPMQDHFYQLTKWGFNLPYTVEFNRDELDQNNLTSYYEKRQKNAEYEVDGLVIYARDKTYSTLDIEGKNPKYSVAFKVSDIIGKEAVVEKIEWNISGPGTIIPLIKIIPINFENEYGGNIKKVKISSVTGHNARNILKNQIGPGAKILVGMNIIPVFIRTLEGVEDINVPEDEFEWDEKKVHFIIVNKENPAIILNKILLSLKALGIKGFAESKISALLTQTKIKSIYELYSDLVFNPAYKACESQIVEAMRKTWTLNMDIKIFMVSTGLFVSPFGITNIKKLFSSYSNVLNDISIKSSEFVIEKITKCGFKTTAVKFYECLSEFMTLYKKYLTKFTEVKEIIQDKLEDLFEDENMENLTINYIEPILNDCKETSEKFYSPYLIALFKNRKVAVTTHILTSTVRKFLSDIKAEFVSKLDKNTILIYSDECSEEIKNLSSGNIFFTVTDLKLTDFINETEI